MPEHEQQRHYRFGPFHLDPARHLLHGIDGRVIALKPKALETLLYLVEHAGELLDKSTLMRAVWGDTVVEENNLNQHISTLRRVLGESPGENRFIVTVPGRGYRFVAPVHSDALPEQAGKDEPVDTGLPRQSPAPGSTAASRDFRTSSSVWLAAGFVLAVAIVALVWALHTPESERSAGVRLPSSVAVLPFENLSPDPDHVYFASGIHEEVLNQLARLEGFNVVSRTSVMRYGGSGLSVPEIARELDVETVLEGSVRYSNGRVRISVQLIDAARDRHLWSEVYERDFSDIFEIQSDIATSIAGSFQTELTAADRLSLAQTPTDSPAALALYFEANGIVYGTGISETAHMLLDRAIEIDPGFARAYGLKARLDSVKYIFDLDGSWARGEAFGEEIIERAREWARRALELDPQDQDARMALRNVDIISWRWSAFEQPLDPPGEPELMQLWILSWLGRHAEALHRAETLVELNPRAVNAHFGLGTVQAFAGDWAASRASVARALELAPGSATGRKWLALNAIALGDYDSALADLELTERLMGENRSLVILPGLAYAYARIGRHDEARRLSEEVRALGESVDIGAGAWALAHLAIGDEDEAVRWLEVAAERARNQEADRSFIHLIHLAANTLADRRLEQAPFADVLARIRGY